MPVLHKNPRLPQVVLLDERQLLAELISGISKETAKLSVLTIVILTSSSLTDTTMGLEYQLYSKSYLIFYV